MYTKDKDRQITVRLSEEQYQYLKRTADQLEVTPSKFLRMVVNSTMVASKNGVHMIMKNTPVVAPIVEEVSQKDGDN